MVKNTWSGLRSFLIGSPYRKGARFRKLTPAMCRYPAKPWPERAIAQFPGVSLSAALSRRRLYKEFISLRDRTVLRSYSGTY